MAKLDSEFIASLAECGKPAANTFRWYLTAVVALGALNYPEEIPGFYRHLLDHYIPESEQKQETRKILEGLTKVCGIQGAAKTGNATRALAVAIPDHLRDGKCYREKETFEKARERGLKMLRSIYGPNPDYDGSITKTAAPDYSWIVTNLFYSFVFSFDEILNSLETGQVIVATLLGIDCQEQVKNHMIGMMFNGARRGEIVALTEIVLLLADRLGVALKGQLNVPEMPNPKPVDIGSKQDEKKSWGAQEDIQRCE